MADVASIHRLKTWWNAQSNPFSSLRGDRFNPFPWLHPLLLLSWIVLGAVLRFVGLAEKPVWTDEFSTIVFSLGQSFLTVPLNEVISLETLLQPLQPNPGAGIGTVTQNLLLESNHPPLYFVLTHWWLSLFPAPEGFISIWGVRSLSSLFGVLSIPAAFGLGQIAFRSKLVGQFAAALMALSPFGIYLAQEARHYTLGILWIIPSLACLVVAARCIRQRQPLPIDTGIVWVVVNCLGVATHYFFALTLIAEAFVVMSLGLVQSWRERGSWHPSHWGRMWAVAVGTAMGSLVWLPLLQNVQDSELTTWIYAEGRSGWAWLDPIVQAIAGWITMLYLLPIQAPSRAIAIASGIILIGLVLWTLPKLYWGLRAWLIPPDHLRVVQALGGFVMAAIALFFILSYFLGIEITSAFRYNFVYFPAVIVLVGAALANCWTGVAGAIAAKSTPEKRPEPSRFRRKGQRTVLIVCLFSLLGALTVISNLGYQKTHRPESVATAIQQTAQAPVLVAIAHRTHGQTGRLMGIAWELRQNLPANSDLIPRFLLAHQGRKPKSSVASLQQNLVKQPRPLDLWLINFQSVPEQLLTNTLQQQSCREDQQAEGQIDGYRYQRYRCS